jgi:hypothetical protein
MATRQRIFRVQILQMSRVLARVLADAFSARFVLKLWLARLASLAGIHQAVLPGLARLDDIRQAVLRGLARLAKGEFGEFGEIYANLANLANLASVG